MSRVFVIGDIHGAFRALRQCLDRSEFDYNTDHLICLGDVADGWPETKASIDELRRIKNLIYLLGNHDWWTLQWMLTGEIDEAWYKQGGKATLESYNATVAADHLTFFLNAHRYYVYENKLFVHAGIDPYTALENQSEEIFLWDRRLASLALDLYEGSAEGKLTSFDEVYIGHTPISYPTPIKSFEIWLMDTGAGWSGVLSMMEIRTKQMFISDPVPSLYPGIQGRRRKS